MTSKKNKVIILLALLAAVAIPAFYMAAAGAKANAARDVFAKCLTEKGMNMYGAYWCPHCANMKKLFGSSFRYVNYIECDVRGENQQHDLCVAKNIKGYPTWEFSDGSMLFGEAPFAALGNRTGCVPPQ